MQILSVIAALVSILLIGAVLVQNPKGGGVDSTFGGSAANQVFGASKSSDFIDNATWGLAIILFAICIATAFA